MSRGIKPGDAFLEYRIIGVIGQGGMGEVFEAVEEYSEDVVAIKCLSPRHTDRDDFARRFRQECKFYPKLKHPNIVRMRRAGMSPDDVAFIVMDRLEGRTLRRLLDAARRLDFLNATHIMIQVADAMRFAHSKGIWHRDLKPENIMVGTKDDAKGHVWLLDFGIAKSSDGGMNTDDLPDVGTLRYMSPEQVRTIYSSSKRVAPVKPDGRADIYAFGAIYYEVLAGRHLFIDDEDPPSCEETMAGHLHAEPAPVHTIAPGCPMRVWPVVARCIAIDRDARYGTFDEVARDLRALVREAVPAGHLLERRFDEETVHAERRAAFDAVAIEAMANAEPRPAVSGGSEHVEPSRSPRKGVGGESMPPRDAPKHETAPLADFVPPVSPLPFVPAPTPGDAHATTPVTSPRRPASPTPTVMITQPRDPKRPYLLAPVVGLAITLTGTIAALVLQQGFAGPPPPPPSAESTPSAAIASPPVPAASVASAPPSATPPASPGSAAPPPTRGSAAPPQGTSRPAKPPRAPARPEASRTPVAPLVDDDAPPKKKGGL